MFIPLEVPYRIFSRLNSEHEEFLELIYTYGGAEYFDPHHSNVYKYALLLFSCHRFGDAIHYLYAHNKVFAATHLCQLATYYGLILPYQDLLCNPSLTIVKTYAAPSVSATPWTLVCAYIKNILYPLKGVSQESNKERILNIICDYVFLLHTNSFLTYSFMLISDMKDKVKVTCQRFLSEVLQEYILSLSSEEVSSLVGSISLKEGEHRGKLYVDTYLSQEDKRQLLKSIGYLYIHNYHDVESGIHFLLLSQQYIEAMVELCDVFVQQIVLLQSSTNITEHFDYWLQYTHNFKSKFLASDSLILSKLSSSMQGAKLLNVFSCLMSLSLGMRILLAKGHAEEAWAHLKEFLPDANTNATPSLSVVLTHSLLRPVADTVLLTLAKCICSIFTTNKQTQHARNDMYMQCEAKMREMKEAYGNLCKFVDKNKDFLVAAEKTKQEIAQLYQVLM
ncbi:hypothetical protein EON65_25005 [archaeon]|nr:MAG: hypothetical protein EON65_25005 [archaeon]